MIVHVLLSPSFIVFAYTHLSHSIKVNDTDITEMLVNYMPKILKTNKLEKKRSCNDIRFFLRIQQYNATFVFLLFAINCWWLFT